ncbi:MAG: hypothetical protein ACRDJF_06475, partial [Actinomycetota bacterium]
MSNETAVGFLGLFVILFFLLKKDSQRKFLIRASLILLAIFALRSPESAADSIESGASATMGVLGKLADT